MAFWRRKHVGLALGGGGARGLAHIGVLQVLEEESIPVDVITGTSIGALIGAAYASGQDPHALEAMFEAFLESPVFQRSALTSMREVEAGHRLSITQKIQAFFKNQYYLAKAMFRPGLLGSEDFSEMIAYFVPEIDIRDTAIPFRAVATELVSGQPVVLSTGPLRSAVMASCAVPGAIPPVEIHDRLLSDGGIINLIPVSLAKTEGARFVIGVDVTSDLYSQDEFRSAMDIYVRASEIMGYHLSRSGLREADVVIRPQVGALHWTDFLKAGDLIQEGKRACRERIGEVRKGLPLHKRWRRKGLASRSCVAAGHPETVEEGPAPHVKTRSL
jgi:NTE family protein